MKKLTPKEEDILSYFSTNGPLFIRELLNCRKSLGCTNNTLSTIVRVRWRRKAISGIARMETPISIMHWSRRTNTGTRR